MFANKLLLESSVLSNPTRTSYNVRLRLVHKQATTQRDSAGLSKESYPGHNMPSFMDDDTKRTGGRAALTLGDGSGGRCRFQLDPPTDLVRLDRM